MAGMKRGVFTVGCALATFAVAHPGVSLAATPEEPQALSERAAAHIVEFGEQKAFVDFARKDGGFAAGELYVFCYGHDGVVLAHGDNPSWVGRNLLHLKDPDGREPIVLGIDMAFEHGRGWIDFKWPNPATMKIERKSSYIIRTNDVACGVGYYKG